MVEDASWRRDAAPGTEGERAQLRWALAKAELLAIFVERLLDEDATVRERWPKLQGTLDRFLEELRPWQAATEAARTQRKAEAFPGAPDTWTTTMNGADLNGAGTLRR